MVKQSISLLLLASFTTHGMEESTVLEDKLESYTLFNDDPQDERFLMRWRYQEIADHVYDPIKAKRDSNPLMNRRIWPTKVGVGVIPDPTKIKHGDIIFIRRPKKFFENVHPKIKVPYIVISGGERLDGMRAEFEEYLADDNILVWFGIHPCHEVTRNPKFTALPHGMEQNPENYKNSQKLHELFATLRTSEKKQWVYLNFSDKTHPSRPGIRKHFTDKEFCFVSGRVTPKQYLTDMSECHFTLSPPGDGIDCYRTWESLLVGTIPIVSSSALDSLYEEFPVFILEKWGLHDWSEITLPLLKEVLSELVKQPNSIRKLYTTYWEERIKAIQKVHQGQVSVEEEQ